MLRREWQASTIVKTVKMFKPILVEGGDREPGYSFRYMVDRPHGRVQMAIIRRKWTLCLAFVVSMAGLAFASAASQRHVPAGQRDRANGGNSRVRGQHSRIPDSGIRRTATKLDLSKVKVVRLEFEASYMELACKSEPPQILVKSRSEILAIRNALMVSSRDSRYDKEPSQGGRGQDVIWFEMADTGEPFYIYAEEVTDLYGPELGKIYWKYWHRAFPHRKREEMLKAGLWKGWRISW